MKGKMMNTKNTIKLVQDTDSFRFSNPSSSLAVNFNRSSQEETKISHLNTDLDALTKSPLIALAQLDAHIEKLSYLQQKLKFVRSEFKKF